MKRWLMKSEPEVLSIEALGKLPKKTSGWDGVRNYEARNFMKAMKKGDLAFFYHSNAEPSGIAGVCEIAREAYPDPTQFDPKSDYFDPRSTKEKPTWEQVDVRFVRAFPRLIPLEELRSRPELAGMALFRRNRLSITPVTDAEWASIEALAKRV
jgi:predicted RNA-binding protein with PUA-like domain